MITANTDHVQTLKQQTKATVKEKIKAVAHESKTSLAELQQKINLTSQAIYGMNIANMNAFLRVPGF